MAWGGAGIGAAIGALVGGPIGAGIGAAIGHYATDDSDEDSLDVICPHCNTEVVINTEGEIWSCPNCQKSFIAIENIDEDEILLYMHLCIFGLMAKMAKIDGVVSQKEAQQISGFMDEFCDNDEERSLAKEMYNMAKNDENTIEYYAELLYSFYNDNEEFREIMYRVIFEIASADGGLEEIEKDALLRLVDTLQVERGMFQYLYDELIGNSVNIDEYYAILECSMDATDSEIKRAYHKKVAEYHPDTLASKNLPESFIRFANEQMNTIREAYEAIMESRR